MFGIPERNLRDCRDSSYFLRFAKNKTSQGGEDGILSKLFELIGTTDTPFCVDIGAWDGQHLSNTFQLIHEFNWGGLLVEANEERHAILTKLYAGRADVACIDCLVDIDGDSSLNVILQKQGVPFDLDFVSIDVDGADYHLWHTIGSTYKPRVMCIEFNPTIPNHVHYVQERDIAIQEGSSLLALTELGRSFGYHLVVTTTFNAIFVRQDLMHHIPRNIFTYLPVTGVHKLPELDVVPIQHNAEHSIERVVDLNSLHNCSMATDIFQTYSGELKLCGPKKLMWHRVSMNIQQMQAIKPKKDRVFPFAPPYTKSITSLESSMVTVVSLLRSIAHQPPSYAAELKSALNALFSQCTDVYSESKQQSTATLKNICKEIWLNAVCMIIVVCRNLSVAEHISGDVLSILYGFLHSSAAYFEMIGDQYDLDGGKSSASATKAILEDRHQWYQRAIQISVFLSTANSVGNENNDFLVSRLSRKLSSGALQTVAAPAWIQSLREPSAGLDVASGAGGVVQSSVDDVDQILQGLFWKELSASVYERGGDADSVRTLNKKWRAKLLWAESSANSSTLSNSKSSNHSENPQPNHVHVFCLGICTGCIVGGLFVFFATKASK